MFDTTIVSDYTEPIEQEETVELTEPTSDNQGRSDEVGVPPVNSDEDNESTNPTDPWAVPEEFESSSKGLEWYATQYQKAVNELTQLPDVEERIQPILDERLGALETELNGVSAFYKTLQINPSLAVARYMPELLASIGMSPVLSEEQIATTIEQSMIERFGENYQELYNANDLINPRSVSAEMWNYSIGLSNEYRELNEQNKQQLENLTQNVAPTEQDRAQVVEQGFAQFEENGLDRQQYEQFINNPETTQIWKSMTPYDLYKVANFDSLIQQAKEQGITEGKKGLYNQIHKEGNAQESLPASVRNIIQREEEVPFLDDAAWGILGGRPR